jgi:hypothetical protein
VEGKYGGRQCGLRRLKELQAENAKRKRMCAQLPQKNAAVKNVLSRKL